MKLRELLNVISKDQKVFISIYSDHDIPAFRKGKVDDLTLDEDILNCRVVCVDVGTDTRFMYIDCREDEDVEL